MRTVADHDAVPEAVLLDALGTLVHLEDPFGALAGELAARGIAAGADAVRAALRAEMAYYRAHCIAAADAASLAALRARCGGVLAEALRAAGVALTAPPAEVLDALLAALRFAPYPDVRPALERWRVAGARLAVVSNWDVSLHDVLARTGLTPLLDAVVTSAEVGAAKPAVEPFAAALGALGADPAHTVHVGDSPREDVAGAHAAGLGAVLVLRDGAERPAGTAPQGSVRTVRSLAELWPPRAAR